MQFILYRTSLTGIMNHSTPRMTGIPLDMCLTRTARLTRMHVASQTKSYSHESNARPHAHVIKHLLNCLATRACCYKVSLIILLPSGHTAPNSKVFTLDHLFLVDSQESQDGMNQESQDGMNQESSHEVSRKVIFIPSLFLTHF